MLLHNRLLGTMNTSGGFVKLFLNHFEGTNGDPGPFLDVQPGITWTDDCDNGTAVFTTSTSKFGASAVSVPVTTSGINTIECGQFTDLTGRSWTFEGWVRLTAGATNTSVVFGAGKQSSHVANASMNLRPNSDLSACDIAFVTNTLGALATSTAFALSPGVYYHAAFSYDKPNDNYELRFNGIREIQYNGVGSIADPDNDFMLTHSVTAAPIVYDEWRGVLGLPYTGATYAVPTGPFT